MKSLILSISICIRFCPIKLWTQEKHDFYLNVSGGLAAGPDARATLSIPTGIATSIGIEKEIAKQLRIGLHTEIFSVNGFDVEYVSETRRTIDIQAMAYIQTKRKEGLYLDLGIGMQYKFHKWVISTTDRYAMDFVYDGRRIVVPASTIAPFKESSFGYTIRPGIYKSINKNIDGGLYIQFQNDNYKYSVYSLRLSLRTKL